jgi:hypothetical protein
VTIREHINLLAAKGLTEKQLRKAARDRGAPWTQRAAAERILRTLEMGDLADFDPVLDGTMTLAQIRDTGVNTEVVKKCKVKIRTTEEPGKPPVTEVEREIELYDRAGSDFDRVMDRTEGRPKQAVDLTSDGAPVGFTLNIGKADGSASDSDAEAD